MKSALFYLLLLVHFSCLSQEVNTELDSDTPRPYLVGKINIAGLSGPNYTWFLEGKQNYEVDDALISKVSKLLKPYNVTIFLGTWCGDSRRQVPRFLKILEACHYPIDKVTMVALDYKGDHYKKSPTHEERGLNIVKVPTFIFYKNAVEKGRIVERPVNSLEKDIISILTTENN